MPADNETPEEGNSLSDLANLHLAEDEERLAGVQAKLEPASVSAEQWGWVNARTETFGEVKGQPQLDRSLPVGQGPGFRQGTNWRDAQARRMFALDQGMADQDEARSPTMDSTDAAYWSTEYLNHALAQTQALDPELSYELALADRFLVMYPELSVTTRSGFGFAGISEQLTAEIMGIDIEAFATQAEQSYLKFSDVGDQFYSTFGNQLDPNTKDLILVSLAGLSDKEQKRHFGLMAAYIDARPLDSMEDQIEFSSWIASTAAETYAIENDQSGWGKFGRVGAHIFTNPADWIQDQVLGSLWTAASDPADAWYRKELQLEETMAISMGYDVGTEGWATFTGLAGMGIDVIIDPTNIALGGIAGLKAVRTAAMIDDAVRNTSRFSRVARQFVPFGSRKAARAAGLPVGVRGRSSRILWAAFAKTQDGLIDVARNKGVFEVLAKTNSYSQAIEQIPELRKVDVGLVQAILRRDTAEGVEALYSSALRGSLLDPTSMAHTDILLSEIEAQTELKVLLMDLDPKAFTAGDIAAANGGGVYHNLPIRVTEGQNAIDDILEGGTDAVRTVARRGEPAVARAGKGEDILKADEVTRKNVLASARLIIDRADLTPKAGDVARAPDVYKAVPLADGTTATFANMAGDGLMAFNDEGKLMGVLIGDSLAVDKAFEGRGIGSSLLRESGKDLSDFTKGTGSISEQGAQALNRAFPQPKAVKALESNVGRAMDPMEDGIVSFIRKGDTQVINLNPGTKGYEDALRWIKRNTKYKKAGVRPDGTIRKDAMQAYMRANNKDVATVNGSAVFVDLQKMKDEGKIMSFNGGQAQHSGLGDAANNLRVAAYERRMVTPKADAVSKWVISDMPYRVGRPMDDTFFWRKKFGVFSGDKYSEANWLKRKMRGAQASIFLDDVPARIATGFANRQDGVRDLTRLLTQMGVDPDLVRRSLDAYVDDPSQAVVLQILRNAADDMGDEEIILGLMKFNDKVTSEMEYAVINNSEQLTSGIRVDGSEGLQPLIPSQTRQFVQLPDQKAFSAHIRRSKRATQRVFKHRNRGWGSTRVQRKKLVDGFGEQLSRGSEEKARWLAMTDDERMAVAYATVRPANATGGDGLGYAAKFGQYSGEQWSRLRNAFSVSMLAWRPIGWMGNEMLDNAWRASMADGQSFFTNPFQAGSTWYDARNIRISMEQRGAYQELTAPIRAAMRGKGKPADVLDAAEEFIPDIRKYVDQFDHPKDQAKAVADFMNTEMVTMSDSVPGLSDPLAAALNRQRKGYNAAQKYSLPSGGADELFNPNWDEVGLTGMEQSFTMEVAAASGRHQYTVGKRVSPELLDDYTTALGNVWARDLRDPVIRMHLEQVAKIGSGGTDNMYAARAFVNSASWNVMEEPVRNMARFSGQSVDSMTDLELSAWYFKNKIKPYVDDIFGDALDSDNVAMMRSGDFATVVDGKTMLVSVDDPDTVKALVHAANGSQYVLPQSVVGVVNPRNVFAYGKEADGWRTPLKSYNQWSLEMFGHKLPANLQRNPAYISTFKRYKDNYMRLGMTAEGADFAANQKALEHIQKTFFFVEAQTPFLKKMNEIFPFFAAQYEIVKAWTWNIPAAQGGFGIGHARMLRTFDHVFTSMRENGLLQPRYDREGAVEGWNLQFAQDPHTDNLAGQFISFAGWAAAAAPALMVEQIAEVFLQADLDLTPDDVNVKFNHPIDFFGRGGGVLPTARMQFGLNPAMAYPTSTLIKQLPFTSTSNANITAEETDLETYLMKNDVIDKTEFLTANRHVLMEAGVTEAEFARLSAGTLGFSTINVPKGTAFMHPGTTLAGQFIKNLLFPYGQTDSIHETVSDYLPTVVQNMAKTMGLFLNDGEEGATMWLPSILMGPTGRSGMGAARSEALVMLEMQGGYLTRSAEIAEQLVGLDEDSVEWIALTDELRSIDDLIAREVKEISASRAFMQTVFGVIMPFNPKMPTESQTLKQQFYQGRVIADQWAEGNPMPTPFDGQNARDAWDMVAAWAADQTGSFAKQEFLSQHGGRSSILAAIAPRSYWGGTGLPVWDMEKYFEQVEAGDILPLPVDVLRYKIRSSMIQVEREMVFIEEYGNDPIRQAQLMLADGARAKEIAELYNNKWAALEMEDELVNDGAWAKHTLNVADNFVDHAYNENLEILEGINIVQELVELELFPRDPQEARAMRGTLMGLAESARAAVDVYEDGRYADWEVSPRQAILNEYWLAIGDYSEELSKQYEKTENVDTEEQLSGVYAEIAQWRRMNGDINITIGGVKFPSPQARSWNNMDDEHKGAMADAKLADKLEWLSVSDVDHIIEVYPGSEPYMPTSQVARDIFDWKQQQDMLLRRKYRIGGEFIELSGGSSKARDKHQDALDKEFDRRLREAGEFGVIENLWNYPAENFSNFGMIPKEVEWIVPYAVNAHRFLWSQDQSSPNSNAGHVQQRYVLQVALDLFERNPSMRDPFIEFGMRVFQESSVEGIVAQLLGNYKGAME